MDFIIKLQKNEFLQITESGLLNLKSKFYILKMQMKQLTAILKEQLIELLFIFRQIKLIFCYFQHMIDKSFNIFIIVFSLFCIGHAQNNRTTAKQLFKIFVQTFNAHIISFVYFINCHAGVSQNRKIYKISVGKIVIEVICL